MSDRRSHRHDPRDRPSSSLARSPAAQRLGSGSAAAGRRAAPRGRGGRRSRPRRHGCPGHAAAGSTLAAPPPAAASSARAAAPAPTSTPADGDPAARDAGARRACSSPPTASPLHSGAASARSRAPGTTSRRAADRGGRHVLDAEGRQPRRRRHRPDVLRGARAVGRSSSSRSPARSSTSSSSTATARATSRSRRRRTTTRSRSRGRSSRRSSACSCSITAGARTSASSRRRPRPSRSRCSRSSGTGSSRTPNGVTDSDLHVPVEHAGAPRHDVEGRPPQLLRAGDARQAGHRPAPLHVRVVQRDQARHLPPDLRRVLRHRTTRRWLHRRTIRDRHVHARARSSSSTSPGELRALPRRQAADVDRTCRPSELGAAALRQEGLQRLPHDRRLAARRPDVEAATSARRSRSTDGSTVNDGRELHPRVDPVPAGRRRGRGYPPSMPSFEGQLKENEIQASSPTSSR